MSYEKIFEPLKLCNGYARNRIWSAPMGAHSLITKEGYATPELARLHGSRAAGGLGTLTMGCTAVDWEYGRSHQKQLYYWDTEGATALANVVEEIHKGGARASIQLCHAGVWSYPNLIGGKNPIGPSGFVREDGVVVEEMTEKQMFEIADHYAEAALIMKLCGFDSIQVQAAHGWLLGAFISRMDNRRTDKYGGSIENRARFPMLVLDKIREAVGNELAIEFRFSVTEGKDPLAITPEETIEFVKMIEDKIDVFHQSFGTRRDSSTRDRANGGQFYRYGFNLELARQVKESGIKIPVVGVGALDSPDLIEEALEKGWLDGVSIAKGVIADPEFVNKIRDDRTEDIVPCIKCLKCFAGGGRSNADKVPRFLDFHVGKMCCSVNPSLGYKNSNVSELAEISKKVVIVGGGPAGLRAALTAAKRGHKVVLLEKTERLGGIINYAEFVEFKDYVFKYRNYLVTQVNKNPSIEVVLNTEATPEIVASYTPESVIIAFGGNRRPVVVPGTEKNEVWNVEDIYGREQELGENIVIVGGNESGVEAAIHLLDKGKKVTVVASGKRLVPNTDFTARLPLIYRTENRADIYTNSRVTKIMEKGVLVHNKESEQDTTVYADSVVFAIGLENRVKDAFEYSELTNNFHIIGDAKKIADIEEATRTGYYAALQI